jgi:hypothetical protein
MTIAALFVETGGVYFGLEGVDPWDVHRDARKYAGPHPVVCHSPCQRWGRYWSGGPSAKVRRELGDDDGCFAAALNAVRTWGGVLEHPEASHANAAREAPAVACQDPAAQLGRCDETERAPEQGHYGHPARKATWLYACGVELAHLQWGPSKGRRLDEGFHSRAERDAARAAGRKPVPRLSTKENLATPIPFRDLLISIARSSRARQEAA